MPRISKGPVIIYGREGGGEGGKNRLEVVLSQTLEVLAMPKGRGTTSFEVVLSQDT